MGYLCTYCHKRDTNIIVQIFIFIIVLFSLIETSGSRIIQHRQIRQSLLMEQHIIHPVVFIAANISNSSVKNNKTNLNYNNVISNNQKITNSDKYGDISSSLSEQNIQQIRRSLLRELDLETIPDIRKMNVSQEEYSKIYNKYAELDENDIESTTKENSINLSEAKRIQRFFTFQSIETNNETRNVITFPNSLLQTATATNENYGSAIEIDRATLRILIPGVQIVSTVNEYDKLPIANIKVYQQFDNGVQNYVTEKLVYLSYVHPKWADIDVESALEYSLVNNETNIKFIVACDLCDRYYSLQATNLKHLSTLNVLVSLEKTTTNTHKTKRSAPASNSSSSRKLQLRRKSRQNRSFCSNQNTTRCCRYPLEVTFKDLESFEFIIEPKSYDAGFCKGHCPLRYNPANKHALIQSLVWKKDKRAPKPCCAPKKFASLKIIYLDKNKDMKVTTWPKMSVTDCACN